MTTKAAEGGLGWEGKTTGVWGRESPSGVQWRSTGRGLEAKPPEAEEF